jgi:Ca2+/Na+ antiporter
MIRYYCVIIFIFITFTLRGQHEEDELLSNSDSTMMSNSDLIYAANRIQIQADSISTLTELNVRYKKAIDLSDNVINLSNTEISMKNKQLEIYKNAITELTPYKVKQKWYDKKWVNFVFGAATVYLSAVIVSKIE